MLRPLLALSSMSSSYLNMGINIQAFFFLFPSFFFVHFVYIYILRVPRIQANSIWVSHYRSYLILPPFLLFCVRLVYIYILCVSNVEAISLWVSIEAVSLFLLLSRLCIFVHIRTYVYQVLKLSHSGSLLKLSQSSTSVLLFVCILCAK